MSSSQNSKASKEKNQNFFVTGFFKIKYFINHFYQMIILYLSQNTQFRNFGRFTHSRFDIEQKELHI